MTRKERILTFCLIGETVIVFLAAFVLWVRSTIGPSDPPDPWKTMYTVEQWMGLFNKREHQPSAVWKGSSVGSITDNQAEMGSAALWFKDTPAHLLEWQFGKLREQDPLMFLHLLDSDDPQLILTGIHLYHDFTSAKDLTADQATKVATAFRKLLDQQDSRMRWAAIYKLGLFDQLTVDDVERGLNDEVLDVAWITTFYLGAFLRNRTLYDSEGKLIEGDPNDVKKYVEIKRRLAPTLIKHLNYTHFSVRSACARNLHNLFANRRKKEDGRIDTRFDPTCPPRLDWNRADWDTREQRKKLWQEWWAEHGEEALRFAHPPQD